MSLHPDERITHRPVPAIHGAGLGLRRDLVPFLLEHSGNVPRFLELAPENWMNVGGKWGKALRELAERYPLTCHGLSLSLGSPEPLDRSFLRQLKRFFAEYPIRIYTEHLSYAKCDNVHLYDLLPIPFRHEAVRHVVERIKIVQDYLERPLAIENISYYASAAPEMSEAEFISQIVSESGCDLLLDVNNVYVNAFNHHYDPRRFILSLPLDRVAYIHMAGHEQRTPELIIDTHGAPIVDPVFELFEWTVAHLHPIPVLLERDFNIPDPHELRGELARLQSIMDHAWSARYAA